MTLGFAIAPTLEEGNVRVFALTVANPGAIATTLGSVRFDVEGVSQQIVVLDWYVQSPEPLPIVLAPGTQWHGLIRDGMLRGAVAEATDGGHPWHLRAAVGDFSGRLHHSDWLDVEPQPGRLAGESRPRPSAPSRHEASVHVRIPSRLASTSMPWESRQRLVDQFRGQESMFDVLQKFEKARTSQPIRLTREQKAKLLRAIDNWTMLAGGRALPEGVDDLGNALRDELRDA